VSSAPTGTWRARAFADPKRPPVGETTFMVEDYVPDRLEFDLATTANTVSKANPAEVTVDGRYLYGAPAAELELEGEVVIKPADERPGFPRYVFGSGEEEVEAVRQALVAQFGVPAGRLTATGFGFAHPVESNDTVEGRARNRRVELACAASH
jgi:uncharacterized protein YfaS (alpha-2-macroglobulin family)